MTNSIDKLRKTKSSIVVMGLHQGVIQSMLDYDVLLGRSCPTIKAIIARGRQKERFFWGEVEIEIPLYSSLKNLPAEVIKTTTALVNVQSARNVQSATEEAIETFPRLLTISLFAEGTPERHSLSIKALSIDKGVMVVGPSSVGTLVPGTIKLGAIGGTMYEQLVEAHITSPGDVAIITTSGGMANELIRLVTSRKRGISFAVALGGDRYPILDPVSAVLLAEGDPQTREIVFFGELGGDDEHKIAALLHEGKVSKPIICYIAGVVAELFATPPQFGHAKALAQTIDESATAKKKALADAGAIVCDRFDDLYAAIAEGNVDWHQADAGALDRKKAYFMSHISGEKAGTVQLLGNDLLETVRNNSVASLVLSLLLARQVTSVRLIAFTDFILRLLADHSPNVSGAVNTMITARAGKDLVASLSSGLLTIGPRFGGAINEAARGWIDGVELGISAREFVEHYSKKDGIISGIGHKKYRLDLPDPRVTALGKFISSGSTAYLDFARAVESITTNKKANLILNVDGAIAATMLDLLVSELNMGTDELKELVEVEFFNALFVISRTIGFTAHYIDQRRNDEGLFRLRDDDLTYFTD